LSPAHVDAIFSNNLLAFVYNSRSIYGEMSDDADISPSPSSDPNGGYICKICGLAFVTEQALAAHIDSEHPESQHAEVF
jgi:hypothetical protein